MANRGSGLSHGIKIPAGGTTNKKLTYVTRNFPTRHRISYFVLLSGDFTAEAIYKRKHLIKLTLFPGVGDLDGSRHSRESSLLDLERGSRGCIWSSSC